MTDSHRIPRIDTLPDATKARVGLEYHVDGEPFICVNNGGIYEWESFSDPLTISAVKTRVIDVRDYGAVGGGLGTTVAAVGGNITTIRSETGQAWLQTTDSMDLVAFYRAQVAAEATGRSILFPGDDYVFTAPGFVHAGVEIDLDGSTVTNTNANASRFTRSNRVFLFGILAREDFARFATQGWEQTAANIAEGATSITSLTGTMPSAGDILLIRTTAAVGTLPGYVTYNEVVGVAGATASLSVPVERAIVSPIIVNYSTITTLKSTLAVTGEPHRYYCAAGSVLRNGRLVATDGPAYEVNSSFKAVIDVTIDAPRGQGIYGNGYNRGYVRVRGRCGGPKSPIELGVGSALTRVHAELEYSGDDTDSVGSVSGDYPHIQIGEHCEAIHLTGRVRMGSKPATHGVTFPTANRCKVELDSLVGLGIVNNVVVFPSNAETGNEVKGGDYTFNAAEYSARWSAGTGSQSILRDVKFHGDQSTIYSLWFEGPNLGAAYDVHVPEGQLRFTTGATGNPVTGYFREYMQASGPAGFPLPQLTTPEGSWPEDDVITPLTANTTLLQRQQYGRTVTNEGATFLRIYTLTASKPLMRVRFYRTASFEVRVDPAGSETVGTGGAGKYLSLGTDKAWAELACTVAGHWVVTQSAGTVTYEA